MLKKAIRPGTSGVSEFEDGDDDVYATIYDWKEMYANESHYGEVSLAYWW